VKILDFRAAIFFFGAVVMAQALPHIAHWLKGTVRGIDAAARVVRIDPARPGDPTEVEIVTGRTVFHCNQQPAALGDLKEGQEVRIYYRKESGRAVATEVSWTQPAPERGAHPQ
jgi:hypothetical protein